MKRKLLTALKYLLLLAFACGLLWFAFRDVDVSKVFSGMMQAKISWVLLSVGFSITALFSRAYRWKLLIESTGYSPTLKKTFYALMIGYFANLAFPRLGEVTRCGSLSKAEKIPFSSLLGTVIIERMVDVVSLLICIVLAAVIEYKRLGNFLNDNILHPILDKFSNLISTPLFIIIAIILLAGFVFFFVWFIKHSKQEGKESKIFQIGKGLVDGLRSVAKLKRPWLFIFHSFFIWILYFFSGYIAFLALSSTAQLGFLAALFLLVAGGIAMSAPVQGGIGAYHLLVSQGLVLYGLSKQDGLAFATLLHSLQLILVVLFGVIAFFLLFADRKKVVNPSS